MIIAPIYGGVNARLLSVLRDPGPMTQLGTGSGFLCIENNDATAERMYGLIADAGLSVSDMMPWNAYPWYINANPNAAQIKEGVEPLKRIIDMLQQLRVIILHGGSAHNSWRRFTHCYPKIEEERNLYIIKTYHTSPQAFRHPDKAIREYRLQHIRDSLNTAAFILNTDK